MSSNNSQEIAINNVPFWTGTRQLFYLMTPAESSFKTIEEVPLYIDQASPFFFGLAVIELTILCMQKGSTWAGLFGVMNWADGFSSVAAGVISRLPGILLMDLELTAYMYVHEHFRIAEWPWDSAVTWWIALLWLDFAFYVKHRMFHEVNFFWAAHQIHHSSEEFNMSTALRQPLFERFFSFFNIPMALFVPPSVFLVHVQLNTLYQFWIHTEVIETIGPLEYILNTASHHRVHHGRNLFAIDKNYAGVLIIWDRMFGTYADEEEKVVFGLVHPIETWDTLAIMTGGYRHLFKTAWNTSGFWNKVSVFVKGPGWEPGKPRMGCIEDIPDVKAPMERYSKSVPVWVNIYCIVHFLMALVSQQLLSANKEKFSQWMLLLMVMYLMWTLTNIGFIYEHKRIAAPLEVFRCGLSLLIVYYICSGMPYNSSVYAVCIIFTVSLLLFSIKTFSMLTAKAKDD